jgi:xylulokinase
MDSEGNVLTSAYTEYSLLYPRPYWVEADPETWWKAYVKTVKEVISRLKIAPRDISGISISGTNAIVLVDRDCKPVRNAIMQLDKRSVPQAKRIDRTLGEKISKITGNRVAAGATWAPTILYIRENEPEVFQKTYKFLWPAGFIVARLTNEYTMDWSRASWTCFFDIRNKKYSEELLDEMGIPMDKLPETYPCWETVGEVTSKAAGETGLVKGIQVLAGMADTPAAGVGVGAVNPNDFFYVLGTVGRPAVILDKPTLDPTFINCVNAVPETWMSLAAIDGGTVCLRWFKENFAQMESFVAKEINTSVYKLLDQEAEKSPPGSRGLLFFPYISGGRANVVWNENARALFFNIGLETTRADFIRSILEGVTYAVRDNYEKMIESYNIRPESLIMCGGGSKSRIWKQITADILNLKVLSVNIEDAEPIGNAILAAVGTKIFSSFSKVKEVVKISDIIYPREQYHKLYMSLFKVYRKVYIDIWDDFHLLREIVEECF